MIFSPLKTEHRHMFKVKSDNMKHASTHEYQP